MKIKSRKILAALPLVLTAFIMAAFMAGAASVKKAEDQGGPVPDFRHVFIKLFVEVSERLDHDEFFSLMEEMTDEEIAGISFFLAEAGRRELFTRLPLRRVEKILHRTPQGVILESGKKKLDRVAGYTTVVYKQERIDGGLQGEEKILLKYRSSPHSIYMKWLAGPYQGRELLYNEKLLGPGKVRVRESGLLGVVAVTISVDSKLAKRGTNHKATEIGLHYLLEVIAKNHNKAAPKGEVQRKSHGIVLLDGVHVYKMESILPQSPDAGYYCRRIIHYIDYKRSLLVKARIFDSEDRLAESYYYTDIEINPKFGAAAFDPHNPDYDL